ncbi:ATP synthase F1 subunit gamma [soil metagenome]
MRRPADIAFDRHAMGTLVELTSVFEGLASMRISQIKNQVLEAQNFFDELWAIYTQLRVDSLFRFGRRQDEHTVIDKELFIIITAEGGFSGDIDQKLISLMLKDYNKEKHDIIVIGHHGVVQLAQNGISFRKYFKLPEKDQNINSAPIIVEVQKYRNTTVYYQTYISLMVQDVKRISLSAAVQQKGKNVNPGQETISEDNYIFEPSTFAVVDHLERSMLQIAVSQVILESKLAQYASRFRAMSTSHTRADELYSSLGTAYNRSLRSVKDERLKEMINCLRKVMATS